MTQDEIIKMAKEVGFVDEEIDKCQLMLERFAFLVAQHEREQNAKICQELAKDMTRVGEFAAMLCAKLIRGQA